MILSSTFEGDTIIVVITTAIVLCVLIAALISRYKKCPSDKILVIYSKSGGSWTKCIHGDSTFIMPIFHDFAYLDLKPITIDVNLTNTLTKQNIRIDVLCQFTIAISTEEENINNAAKFLLGLKTSQIVELAKDILFGQVRLVIATMKIEEIDSNRNKFLDNISEYVDRELRKIGLQVISVELNAIKH